MLYTVNEVAKLSGTTIKTLYHYQKIGLLMPEIVTENGYRYYGENELKRLQQILFYRELDFSLDRIKAALDHEPDRLRCLSEQQTMLKARQLRMERILLTLEETIRHERKRGNMSTEQMFDGLNEEEWQQAFSQQNEHLQKAYDFQLDTENLDVASMNEKAAEATAFMTSMAEALKNNKSIDDETVVSAIENHLAFLQKAHPIDARAFAEQSRFFLSDEFHRTMLEEQQTGLSYYICMAAENYATK
ncbi:MerR family transcriptional regulator [Brevibacillus antibioticus]|uniref:MerR family transcriptional regulator n=1 Tax=Brevibacillus antibioticus TaxID=2570228 RepID=A0A4V5TIJ4_9BACL|nr:MerR family transcriptional regulator [Brevibacillus antibioticus]TKI55353.1 MerR family transcriptional regulator [Brevibacillus antibioticus]